MRTKARPPQGAVTSLCTSDEGSSSDEEFDPSHEDDHGDGDDELRTVGEDETGSDPGPGALVAKEKNKELKCFATVKVTAEFHKVPERSISYKAWILRLPHPDCPPFLRCVV